MLRRYHDERWSLHRGNKETRILYKTFHMGTKAKELCGVLTSEFPSRSEAVDGRQQLFLVFEQPTAYLYVMKVFPKSSHLRSRFC